MRSLSHALLSLSLLGLVACGDEPDAVSLAVHGPATAVAGETITLTAVSPRPFEPTALIWDFDARDGVGDDARGSEVEARYLIAGEREITLRLGETRAVHRITVVPPTGCQVDAQCDDGDVCNGLERCEDRACVPGDPLTIDDDNACTLDRCDPIAGITRELVAVDDGDPCTLDHCDPDTGEVAHGPRCPAGSVCDPTYGCLCDPALVVDDPCTIWSCESGTPEARPRCTPGECEVHDTEPICSCPADYLIDGASCRPRCARAGAPMLNPIAAAESLVFGDTDGIVHRWRVAEVWSPWLGGPLALAPFVGQRVEVESRDPACPDRVVAQAFDVVATYPSPGTTAVSIDDVATWADAVISYAPGDEVDAAWQTPERALGTAEARADEVVSLGAGGAITLRLAVPSGPGPDLAVYENSVIHGFLELAFVEVSSDGETFVRFPSAALRVDPVGPYGLMDPRDVAGLAGRELAGMGTPFDLDQLTHTAEVLDGQVDLEAIQFVRVVDIIGDGRARDSFGRPIYDPTPTRESAGFDLDAVGAVHAHR